jgi:hypothetical protein
MTHQPRQAAVGQVPPSNDDGWAETEVTYLRAEFPRHWIGTETIVGRGVRYVARACRSDAHPHTVLTSDLGELRAALEGGRPSGPKPPQR